MKKIITFLTFAIITSCAFANSELDFNFKVPFANRTKIEYEDSKADLTLKEKNAFGVECDYSYYFGKNARKFEIGIGAIAGIDVFAKEKFEMSGGNKTESGTGFNMRFGLGPSLRYSFNDRFSMSMLPAFVFCASDFMIDDDEDNVIGDASTGFLIDLGGKVWLKDSENFHLGVNFGLDFMASSGHGSSKNNGVKSNFDVENKLSASAYIGICMNFGKRGIDKF